MARTRYAKSGALRIAYELRGTLRRSRPWLVLIQGLGFDRSGWGPALRRLRRHLRLVLIDNRGSGRSDEPTDSFLNHGVSSNLTVPVTSIAAAPGRPVLALDHTGLWSASETGDVWRGGQAKPNPGDSVFYPG